jgi:hypothetical protein
MYCAILQYIKLHSGGLTQDGKSSMEWGRFGGK